MSRHIHICTHDGGGTIERAYRYEGHTVADRPKKRLTCMNVLNSSGLPRHISMSHVVATVIIKGGRPLLGRPARLFRWEQLSVHLYLQLNHSESSMTTTEMAVLVRIGELVHRASPWHRRLWGIGTCSSIDELADAAELVAATGYGSLSFEHLAKQVGEGLKRDPAMPDETAKPILKEIFLNAVPTSNRAERLRQHAIVAGGMDYLKEYLALDAPIMADIELWSRLIAGHLLDEGWSEDGIRQQIDRHSNTESDPMRSFIEDMAGKVKQNFFVVIQASRVPKELQHSERFVDRNNFPLPAGCEPIEGLTGFFTRTVKAWDQSAAVTGFAAEIDTAIARYQATLRGRRNITLASYAFVTEGVGESRRWRQVEIRPVARRVEVKQLAEAASSNYFEAPWGSSLDNAVILAEMVELNQGPQVPALLWASVESVFDTFPEDPKPLSTTLGWLLAASLVRAELTFLAHRFRSDQRLDRAKTNAERCHVMEQFLRDGCDAEFEEMRDQLAWNRMLQIVSNRRSFERLAIHLGAAIARVHRERNRAMHGGSLTESGGPVALRAGPSLISAVLDRVAWGVLATPKVNANELAARAVIRGQHACTSESTLVFSRLLDSTTPVRWS